MQNYAFLIRISWLKPAISLLTPSLKAGVITHTYKIEIEKLNSMFLFIFYVPYC